VSEKRATVVVTGLGATTPLGGDVESTWSAMLAGRSGSRLIEEEWAEPLPVRIAAAAAVDPATYFDRVQARRIDRCSQFAIVALREAWADAGYTGPADTLGQPSATRVGISLGSGIGGLLTLLQNYDTMRSRGPRLVSPVALPALMPNSSAAQASLIINAQAGLHSPNSACATGAEAVLQAVDMIRLGRADVVVAGGTEAVIHALTIAGFANMMAMSRNNEDPQGASRPFDRRRDGFVLGEGAAMLVLETAEHARARGARVYCELAGVGLSSDAFHLARPDTSGDGVARALESMLIDGDLRPEDIGYVSAHATSTPQGDLAESRALCKVLGIGGYTVSAIKSMTGHMLGAAGALSAVATVRALHDRMAPPTINLDEPDEEIELDIVAGAPRALPGGSLAALSNAVGFGGHNVSLAFRAAE